MVSESRPSRSARRKAVAAIASSDVPGGRPLRRGPATTAEVLAGLFVGITVFYTVLLARRQALGGDPLRLLRNDAGWKRRLLISGLGPAGGIVLASWLLPASADVARVASTLTVTFTSESTASPTGMFLEITYRKPSAPNAKPPAVTALDISLPAGTKVNLEAVAECTATDAQIMALGDNACSASSRVGAGKVSLITGLGSPVDPVRSDVGIFNDGTGFIEVFTLPGLPLPSIDQRVNVKGDSVTAQIPAIPGGPPDFRTAVRTVSSTFPVSSRYLTTPNACPPSGQWISTATFRFADGTSQVASSMTPCH